MRRKRVNFKVPPAHGESQTNRDAPSLASHRARY